MMKHILYCRKCSAFTMKEECSICHGRTETLRPSRYSVEDRYGGLRRKALGLEAD